MQGLLSSPYFWCALPVLVFFGWYACNAFSYAMGSGQLGRGRWWVFECFWEDIVRNVPGGMKHKVARIRESVTAISQGAFIGSSRSWSHDELRRDGDYEACAREMFASPFLFWFGQLMVLGISPLAGAIYIAFMCVTYPDRAHYRRAARQARKERAIQR